MRNIVVIILGVLFLVYVSNVKSLVPKYTENEVEAIRKLRYTAGNLLYMDYMKEDVYLIRWLRAREMNVQEAAKMLREAVKFRREYRIDRILEDVIFTFSQPPFYTDGIDSSGSPVGTFIPGRMDIRKFVVGGRRNDLIRFFDQFLEYGEVGLRSLANNNTEAGITQGTVIYDMVGYNLRQHACVGCISVYFDWIKHYENYFPDMCKYLIFINTPKIFMPLMELIKPLMSKATRKALKVFGPNRQEWVSFLHSYIPADQLRKEFGGTMPE